MSSYCSVFWACKKLSSLGTVMNTVNPFILMDWQMGQQLPLQGRIVHESPYSCINPIPTTNCFTNGRRRWNEKNHFMQLQPLIHAHSFQIWIIPIYERAEDGKLLHYRILQMACAEFPLICRQRNWTVINWTVIKETSSFLYSCRKRLQIIDV